MRSPSTRGLTELATEMEHVGLAFPEHSGINRTQLSTWIFCTRVPRALGD